MTKRPTPRAAVPAAVGAVLLVVYAATLARDVTFWDAGEFIAAAVEFGIPHPPGTPVYVMLLRVAVVALGALGVPAAVATSLVSLASTVAACALGAQLLARATGDHTGAIAGGIASGSMATVWLNATETEVYAASLALSVLTVVAAERAGRERSLRWALLTAYLIALAVPLHLSALLAGAAAVYLVAWDGAGRPSRRALARAVVVAGASIGAYAAGRMSPGAAVLAAVVMAAAAWATFEPVPGRRPVPRAAMVAAPIVLVLIATTALAVLLLRARHDPAINQGDPSTLASLVDVVARRQYAVAAPWPRQAPLWLQVGNLGLWADWQIALGLGPTIFPTIPRTIATLAFALLGVCGAAALRRRNRRLAHALVLLFLSGTLGAALYLNLKAGPSFGHGILPASAVREARERDYFFVLGWWTWGLWAGYGAVALARRYRLPAAAGVAAAMLPVVANWRAVDRTRMPEAALPAATAAGLLETLPRDAVLFVAGDNDTYPLWHAQRARAIRRDVTVITTPLLPADWYRAELARRHGLLIPGSPLASAWHGRQPTIREIAVRAGALGRPVAMAVSMPAADRAAVSERWTLAGPVLVAQPPAPGRPAGVDGVSIDAAAVSAWSRRFAAMTGGRDPAPAIDGTPRYMTELLRCPGLALAAARASRRDAPGDAPRDSLAPICNFR